MLVKLVKREGDHSGPAVIVQTLGYGVVEETISDRVLQSRIRQATSIVQDALGREKAQEFYEYSKGIEFGELFYAAAAFVEHARLSDDELAHRAAILEGVFRDIFGLVDENSFVAQAHRFIAEISFLYPTVCLELNCREACANLLRVTESANIELATNRMVMLFQPFVHLEQTAFYEVIKGFLEPAINYLSLDELTRTGEAVAAILGHEEAYQDHLRHMIQVLGRPHQIPFMQVRAKAVRAMVDTSLDDYVETLEDIWSEAEEVHNRYYADQLRIVYRMIDRDLPTRPVAREQRDLLGSLKAIAENEVRTIIQQVDASVEEELQRQNDLRASEAQRQVAELLAFKDAEPEKQRAVKPKRKGRNGKKRQQQKSRPAKNTSKKTPVITRVETQEPVNPISGLKTYLRFVDAELSGLAERITDIDGAETIAGDIAEMQDRIACLLEIEETGVDDYLDLARDVDRFITDVRGQIRSIESDVREREAFDRALRSALQNEQLEYGRVRGGQLRRGLGTLHWQDIANRFHNRYLDTVSRIRHGDSLRLVAENEAIAFYVTSSSLSGYDFDISCHLWTRRPGRSTPPCDDDGFMNTNDWYDTRVTCCVLHVPKKGPG